MRGVSRWPAPRYMCSPAPVDNVAYWRIPATPPTRGRSDREYGEDAMADELVQTLRGVPLFAEVAPEALAVLATRLRRRTFRRNEVIMHRGDPAGALHVIRSGRVKVTLPSEEGDETVLALMGGGACFGE